nr:hypothetical protein [Chitinispirillaceae bacterium]
WTAMAGFPLGIYIGSRWGIVDKDDGGKVTLMQYFSQTGAFLLGYTLPLYFVSYDTRPENYVSAASLLTMGLLPAGFYAGYRIAGDRYISAGRGTMPYVTGTLGGLTGLLIPTLFEPDMAPLATARLFVTTTLIGYGCGTWLGLDYHKSIDYSYWQAVFIGASSAAGAAIGCSFPLIAQAAKHQAYTIMGIAGAWSGFYFGEKLSLDLFEKSSRDKRSSAIRFNAPGLAALPLLMAAGKPNASQSVSARFMPPLPVANVEWRF